MEKWKKTERAGKDMKDDYYKMRQDGPGALTWTDFEKDCDAINQARASKINDGGYSAYQPVSRQEPPTEDAILECTGSDLEVVSRRQAGELTQERSMTMSRIALAENGHCSTPRNTTRASFMSGNPFGSGDGVLVQPGSQPKLFDTLEWSSVTHWQQSGSHPVGLLSNAHVLRYARFIMTMKRHKNTSQSI